ncbi:MAG: putative Deoxyhypusine synthase, partial [Streblomastix strix]
ESGLNRIGNILVSNDLYCKFETFLTPILNGMLEEQKKGTNWTPSKMISLLGERVNNESSVLYWCWKNKIPVYCPALTDGAVGDNIFFYNARHEQKIRLDIVEDLNDINMEAMKAKKTGIIICGGGVIKHHICNANLMRNGTDFAVYINTGFEGEASDTGASPDEAKSWGKIGEKAEPVKVWGDFTILFPLLVAQTFAKSIFSPLNENHRRPLLYPEQDNQQKNEDINQIQISQLEEKKEK